MQQAISYKPWLPIDPTNRCSTDNARTGPSKGAESPNCRPAEEAVKDNAVVVFGRRGCCMSHVARRLLLGHGVNPAVYEVDEADESRTAEELGGISGGGGGLEDTGGRVQFPAVFIGGRLFGGLDRVMAAHITGELVPVLKEAGALWL